MTKYLKHKAGSVEEAIAKQQPVIDSDYQAKFNEAIKEAGKGIGSMTPKEKSDFYSKMEEQEVEETISERGGANTSSRQGSASRGAKKKYRFGYRVAEKQPKGNDIEEDSLTEGRWSVEGTTGYKNISGHDRFKMIISASSRQDAERKWEDELHKHRKKRHIGPGGGGYCEDMDDIEIEPAGPRDKVGDIEASMTHSYDPSYGKIKEDSLTESTDINFNPPVDMNTLKKYGTFSGQFFTLKGNNQRMFAIKKAGKIGTLKITAGNRGQDSDKQVKAMAKDLRYKIIDDGDADYNMKKEDAEHFGISGIETQRPIEEDTTAVIAKDIATGQRLKVEDLHATIKNIWLEAVDKKDKKGASTAKVPKIKKSNKPGVKIAKIRLKRDKMDGKESSPGQDPKAMEKQILTLTGQVNLLKAKIENEKHKAIKPVPNKETGEVPLTVGIGFKHLRDKLKKEAINPNQAIDNKDPKIKRPKKTATGEPSTEIDTEPKINYNK